MENLQANHPSKLRARTKKLDRQIPCYLLQIPIELRFQIYSYLLPQRENFHFKPIQGRSSGVLSHNCRVPNLPLPFRNATLFRLNQHIRNETYTILYGDNTFTFDGNRVSRPYHLPPRRFQSFFNAAFMFRTGYKIDLNHLQGSFHLIRKCRLALIDPHARKFGDLKQWYRDFATAIEGSEALETLVVEFPTITDRVRNNPRAHNDCAFALEPLAQLHGIGAVDFRGIEGTFIDKLVYVMTSKEKIEIPLLKYETMTYKKRLLNGKKKEMVRTTKLVHEPMHDWDAISVDNNARLVDPAGRVIGSSGTA